MNKTAKAYMTIGMLLGVCHLTAMALYLLPANPMTNSYRRLVNWYMEPLFKQNWRLFAPDPQPFSLKLFYKCQNEQIWQNPHSALLERHQNRRIGPSGKILYVYHAMIRNLMNEKIAICNQTHQGCTNPISNINVLRSPPYQLMKKYVSDRCVSGSFTFRVAQVYSKNFSARNSKDKSGKILFDEYEVQ